jgi:hypothetical protein
MRKPTVLCERAEVLFREIRSYNKFEEKFGTRSAGTAGSGKGVEWLGGLPESAQAVLGFLQSTIYGTRYDGQFKSTMKSGKTAAEMCAAAPLLDEIEQWKIMTVNEACAGRNFQMDAVSVFKRCRLLRHVKLSLEGLLRYCFPGEGRNRCDVQDPRGERTRLPGGPHPRAGFPWQGVQS